MGFSNKIREKNQYKIREKTDIKSERKPLKSGIRIHQPNLICLKNISLKSVPSLHYMDVVEYFEYGFKCNF